MKVVAQTLSLGQTYTPVELQRIFEQAGFTFASLCPFIIESPYMQVHDESKNTMTFYQFQLGQHEQVINWRV